MNRLKDEAKKEWEPLKANAKAGRQLPKYATPTPHKRRRVDPNPSDGSPVSLEDESYNRRRRSSSLKSSHNHKPNESAKNGIGSGIGEYQMLRNTTNPSGGSRRQNRGIGIPNPAFKLPLPSTTNGKPVKAVDIEEDPISDIDTRTSNPPPISKKFSKLEIVIPFSPPPQFSSGHVSRSDPKNGQAARQNTRTAGQSSPDDLDAPTSSRFFPMNSKNNRDLKPARSQRNVENMSIAEGPGKPSQANRDDKGQALDRRDESQDELAVDELTGLDSESSAMKTAQNLLEEQKSNRGRPRTKLQLPQKSNDSDGDVPPNDADIAPTIFKGLKWKPNATKDKPVYGIRWLFNHMNIWLRDNENGVWWLEHNRDKEFLQVFTDEGVKDSQILAKNFHSIDHHENSCKLIIHNKHVHLGGSPTMICIEVVNQKRCNDFVGDLCEKYHIKSNIAQE